MSERPKTTALECRELMSALADGQADAAAKAVALWDSDPDARNAWHAYHLIGDVLRSDDLAMAPRRDAAFLTGIHARLAAEPTVLAPQAAPERVLPGPRAARRWGVPTALAAGVAAAAALLVASRLNAPEAAAGRAELLASSAASAGAAAPALVMAGAVGDPALQVLDGKLIRDARLDGYLRAHRGGGSAAMRGGTIGRFETVVLER